MAHARRSASKFPRLARCPGSLTAEEGFPDQESPYAYEGTCAHHLASVCLKAGTNTRQYAGEELTLPEDDRYEDFPDTFTVDDDMVYFVQEYLDYCRNLKVYETDFKVETRVSYEQWVPEDGRGTADFIGNQFKDNGETAILHVVDLKYGKGVEVLAKDNEQLLCYAMGAWDESEVPYYDEIHIHIFQPRIDGADEHVYTAKEFYDQMDRIEAIAKATDDPNAPRIPGEKQCTFCKACGTKKCPESGQYIVDVCLEGFDILNEVHTEPPSENQLTNEQIGNILANRKMVDNYLKNVASHALDEAMDGESIPGQKLVLSSHNRKWRDPKKMLTILRGQRKIRKAQYLKESLVSFTVIEKIVGKDSPLIKENVYKPEGKPVLAPQGDKRDVYVVNDTEGFDDLTVDDPLADLM